MGWDSGAEEQVMKTQPPDSLGTDLRAEKAWAFKEVD